MRVTVAGVGLALVAVLAGGGCSDSGVTTPGGQSTGGISGLVRSGQAGVNGASVALTGTASRTATSGATGAFSFAGLAPGSYTVTLSVPTGYTLAAGEQAGKPATVVAGQNTTVNFDLLQAGGSGVQVIEVQGFTFVPSDVTVAVGTTVRWTSSTAGHTVTPSGHTRWTEAALGPTQSFEHTFTTPGTFNYFCSPHQLAGMTGVVRVQ